MDYEDLAVVPVTLSKYELARIVGMRLTMVQQGLVPSATDTVAESRAAVIRGEVPFATRRQNYFVCPGTKGVALAERPRTPRGPPPAQLHSDGSDCEGQ